MLLKKRIPMRYVLGKIKVELGLVMAYTILFEVFHHYFINISVDIPIAIPTMVGTIISLLLAFKSNQAYDRWWEARIIWGSIVNESRTLIRQVLTFYKDPDFSVEANDFKENFTKRQIAWCYSLGQALRNKDAIKPIKNFITEEELNFVKNHQNIPNAILLLHARDLRNARKDKRFNTYQQVEIDNTLTRLCDAMGKCERIKNTIFPTTYSMYIRMTLCLFIILLPFGLIDLLSWFAIPLITIIAGTFFLIEKMAIHLQDPFENRPTDTPVTAISQAIEKNLMQMLNEFQVEFDIIKEFDLKPEPAKLTGNEYFVL
ncbi:bestrophin family ion channel [Flavobacterium sp. MMLR14_040]|jgi:ion channel-forming bestrophin family protein|uniref:bestrophin family protein n=1 Tax=Flavobacterium sp. MMLR14_040 TaxID=3093843 RepID=UPI00298F8C32|nr:bestrophin family ion channel [Flavobacterium sp. MMLR14_040]MDW8850542.1 bestrophin family ion channel [Flavobacterium sp. MMLR14_040]